MFLVVGRLEGAVARWAHLVALHDNVAYSHLAAWAAGYERFAAYGVYWINPGRTGGERCSLFLSRAFSWN